jgi:hypothetical protein
MKREPKFGFLGKINHTRVSRLNVNNKKNKGEHETLALSSAASKPSFNRLGEAPAALR